MTRARDSWRRRRPLRSDEAGISTVIGAIVILAILGIAIVSVNAFYVPRQGEALEVSAREEAETALLRLSSQVSGETTAPFFAELPLRPAAGSPPLLAGIVLSPARAEGHLAFDPDATRIAISHVVDAPPEGVPVNDTMRVDEGDGLMRIYDLGNASAGHAVGALSLNVGGAYLDEAQYRLEGGALLLARGGSSSAVATPPLRVAPAGNDSAPATLVAWRVPVLVGGAQEVGGTAGALVSLAPGPVARAGGAAAVYEVRIEVETRALAAWTAALQDAVGGRGNVTSVESGPDRGTVTAVIGAPDGAPEGAPSVRLDLSLVRHELVLTARSG